MAIVMREYILSLSLVHSACIYVDETKDLRSRPPPVNPPLSFCDVHVNAIPSKSRKIYYLPREIYIPAVSVSIFTRAEWGKGMEREIVL